MELKQTKTTVASYAGIELLEIYTHDIDITAYLIFDGKKYQGCADLRSAIEAFGKAINSK